MSVPLSVGDVVFIKPTQDIQTIGLIKYVGPMVDRDVMSQYVGIELLESVPNGHNGTIDGFTYFTASSGYGFHTKITNVIKKVFASDLFEQMQQLYAMLRKQSTHISKLESRLKNANEESATATATATAPDTPTRIYTNLRPCLSPGTHSNQSTVSRQSIQSRQSVAHSIISSIPSAAAATSYKISYHNIAAKPSINNQLKESSTSPTKHSNENDTASTDKKHKKRHHHKKHKKKSKEKRKSKMNSKRKSKSKASQQKRRSQSDMYDSLQSVQPQQRYASLMQRNRAHTADSNHLMHSIGNAVYTANNRRASAYEYASIQRPKPMMITDNNDHSRSASLIYVSQSAPASPFMAPQQFNLLPPAPDLAIANQGSAQYLEPNSAAAYANNAIMKQLAPTQSHTQLYADEVENNYNHPSSIRSVLMNGGAYSQYNNYNDESGAINYPLQHIRTTSASPTHHYEPRRGSRHNTMTPPQAYEPRRRSMNNNALTPQTYEQRKASIARHRSASPYRAELAQYNEYRRNANVNTMSTSPITIQQSANLHSHQNSANKMYQIHENGVFYSQNK